jgi:hypothetical protein
MSSSEDKSSEGASESDICTVDSRLGRAGRVTSNLAAGVRSYETATVVFLL